MNMKKLFSFMTAATLSAGMLAALPVCAETAYELGDVDMDGYITGHDSAMVSRYLTLDSDLLSDEQLVLADVNEDGVVDQTDADLIHESEEYAIGCITDFEFYVDRWGITITRNISDAYYTLMYYAFCSVGKTFTVAPADAELAFIPEGTMAEDFFSDTVNQLTLNLMDVDADGAITLTDALLNLLAYANEVVGNEVYANGVYYLTLRDGDKDGAVSTIGGEDYTAEEFIEADTNGEINYVDDGNGGYSLEKVTE